MKRSSRNTPAELTKRRLVANLVGLCVLPSLVACGKFGKARVKAYEFDVMMYSFLDRPIFDIDLNGTDIGDASDYGTTGVVGGVTVPLGQQSLIWRLGGPQGMARNGEKDAIKNVVTLQESEIASDANYMGGLPLP